MPAIGSQWMQPTGTRLLESIGHLGDLGGSSDYRVRRGVLTQTNRQCRPCVTQQISSSSGFFG
jgi:hypothetical protein